MKQKLQEFIEKTLLDAGIDTSSITIAVEKPKEKEHGDYATNVAMQLSRNLHQNPHEIASNLVSMMSSNFIQKVEIAGPGFINFYLKKDYLFENIHTVLKKNESYGSYKSKNPKKVNIEFVSANPTGILHLGHARGASYGDALARIMSFAGYDVTREYYINDAGNQIGNLEASIKARYQELCGLNSIMPENGYHGKEIIDIASQIKEQYGDTIPSDDVFKDNGIHYLLSQIKKDLKAYRVDFDVWTSEKSIYEKGNVKKTLDYLEQNGYTYVQDNATWLKTTLYGDEKDRVLVKKDETNTYLLPDIAYHMDKYSRGYDELIDVLGADHHGYIARLKAAIKMMGENPDKLMVDICQMVRLVHNGEEVKMSKRTGNVVTMNELVEEVGLDATRYFFAMRSLDSQMDFDLDLATKNSNENPVYYIQYAYARICSIIREYGKEIPSLKSFKTLTSDYVMDILAKIYQFEEIVLLSANKRAPHYIANYAYDLANLFHTFYAHEKVLSDDTIMTEERLCFIKAVAITLKNALHLIGVEAKEKM